MQPSRPLGELGHDLELGGIVLAAVRDVYRSDHEIAVLHLDDARFHVERRMAEHRIDGEEVSADV